MGSTKSKNKVKSKINCKPVNTKSDLISETKKFQERLQKINGVKLGFKELYQVLDKSYLRLFFGSVLVYFLVGLIICGIYLSCIYIFNESLWYTYFPTTDQYYVKDAKDELWISVKMIYQVFDFTRFYGKKHAFLKLEWRQIWIKPN